jgi:hypothetical protein
MPGAANERLSVWRLLRNSSDMHVSFHCEFYGWCVVSMTMHVGGYFWRLKESRLCAQRGQRKVRSGLGCLRSIKARVSEVVAVTAKLSALSEEPRCRPGPATTKSRQHHHRREWCYPTL